MDGAPRAFWAGGGEVMQKQILFGDDGKKGDYNSKSNSNDNGNGNSQGKYGDSELRSE